MPFKLEEHTGILIKKAARLFEQMANKNLDVLGVTYAQTIFLVRLWENEGQTQIELARSAGLKQPSVVRILDRMERDQLITRVRNQEDRRAFNFYLTEKAREVCCTLENHANAMQDMATLNLSKKDIDQLNYLVSRLTHNLQQALEQD